MESERDYRRLRGVGVGAGYFSQFQYDAWQRIPQVDIVAIADLDGEKARRASERFGIPRSYTDFREMLDRERPDFVDVITPPDSHLEICRAAADRGLAVICQKPLAPTYDEAARIVKAVQESGVRFMVHENWRWQPWYREIKTLQRRDELGDLLYLHFHCRTGDGWGEDAYLDRQPYFREYPRLFVFETGVHFVDTFRFLLGEVTSVYARLQRHNPVIKGEDAGQIVLGFENGATAILDANRYSEPETDDDPRYTFGTMRVDAGKGHLRLRQDGSITLKPLGRPAYEHSYVHEDRGPGGDSCFHLQKHFVSSFLAGKPFESEGSDYLRTLRVVEACYASNSQGQVVRLAGDGARVDDDGFLNEWRESGLSQ